jgi:hypothetical protein
VTLKEVLALAHFTTAVVLNPYLDLAWKHLGYVRHHGRWMSREQIVSEEREADAQRKADHHWEPLLARLKIHLREKVTHNAAAKQLAELNDPRAVPSIERVFLVSSAGDQSVAVGLLTQIDSATATESLAGIAVQSEFGEVRQSAIRALKERNRSDFAGKLVDMIHTPAVYQFQPVQGPGSKGTLVIDTPKFKMTRTYDAPAAFQLGRSFRGYVGLDPMGLPVVISGRDLDRIGREKPAAQAADIARAEARTSGYIANAQFKAAAAQQQLTADLTELDELNRESAILNERLTRVLRQAADAPDLKDDEDAWHRWWYDLVGYRYESPPKVTLEVNALPQTPAPRITSCFVAGTLVRTLDGHRPIESLKVGDQVLSQDISTAALGFQPILVVHHNPPGATMRLKLSDGETLVASTYHRFWRPGLGWIMAKDLTTGDALRTLTGRVSVVSAEPGPNVPVYNLDVAVTRTFFVGSHDALVHDNTLPDPRTKPFDASVSVIAARSPGK